MNNLMGLVQNVLNNSTQFNNPMLNNAVGMYKSNNQAGLEAMARNLCQERGIDINDLQKRLGLNK